MRQEVRWVEVSNSTVSQGEIVEKPTRIWTLLGPDSQNVWFTPELPIVARHGVNAFLEDCVHDWNIRNGKLYYYSRITEGKIWILLEFED